MNNCLEYNSTRERLIMPEYGRTVQMMVKHAMTIEDRNERNRCARTIVKIMAGMYPQPKDAPDSMQTFWDHLAIISDFKLDIDSPYPMPEREKIERKPDRVPYCSHRIKLKHYGHIVEDLINEAVGKEDIYEKKRLVEAIANYMKNSLLAWNKDFATDERLFNDIYNLSEGRIEINEEDGIKTAAYHKDLTAQNQNGRNNFKRNAGGKDKKNQKNNKANNNRRGGGRNRY